MNSLNILGVRIVGITLVLVLVIFGAWKGIELGLSKYQTSKIVQVTISPTPNTQPPLQKTTTPALTQELTKFADVAKETLVGYTKQYVESLPTDIEKGQVLDPKKVEVFVIANKGKLLPDLPAGTVQTTTKSGKQAIQGYLDTISPIQNSAIAGITGDKITSALGKQESGEDPQALASIQALLGNNFKIFQSVQVPKEAAELHTTLLRATQALINNVKLLQEIRKDVVGGLIGEKNLVDLNGVFTDIEKQIIALETKYDIK